MTLVASHTGFEVLEPLGLKSFEIKAVKRGIK